MCCQSQAHSGDRSRALQLHVTAGLPELQVCEGVKPLPLCFCWDLNPQGEYFQQTRSSLTCLSGCAWAKVTPTLGALALTLMS